MNLKSLSLSAIIVFSINFSGCSTATTTVACTQTIPNSISKVGCDSAFIIGKTSKSEVEEKLGATMFSYKKPNNTTKLVYLYSEHIAAIKRSLTGAKGLKIILELWFDKNGILFKKKYSNDPHYQHPEMMETYNNALKLAPERPKGGYGSITSPLGVIQNIFK